MKYKVAPGTIPEKITYLLRDPEDFYVGVTWDIDEKNPTLNETVKARDCIALEENDAEINRTKAHLGYNGRGKTPKPIEEIAVPNEVVSGIRVIKSNYSNEYLAIIKGNYLITIPTDIILDALLKGGVEANGYLKGEFIWIKLRNNCRLVRVGSTLHSLVQEYEAKRKLPTIKPKELEVGKIYATRRKTCHLFLGTVDTIEYNHPPGSNRWEPAVNIPGTNAFGFFEVPHKKRKLFMKIDGVEDLLKSGDGLSSIRIDDDYHYKFHNFCFKKTLSFVETMGEVSLPPDIVNRVREIMVKKARLQVVEWGKSADSGYQKERHRNYIADVAPFFNMHLSGDIAPPKFDPNKLLTFI